MLSSHFGAVSFGVAGLSGVPGAPAPVTPDQVTAQSSAPFPVPVYSVQCALRVNILNYPGGLEMPAVDGKWGPKTKAALDYYLILAGRTSSTFFYDTPAQGATVVSMSAGLIMSLLQGVDADTCPRPAGITATRSAAAPQPTLAPPPPGTGSSGMSWTPILIGVAAVGVLGGLGWVMWRRRGRLKQRIKG